MRVLSLFSGIGGLELGLERAGFTVAGQCEIEPFPRAVLAERWPDVWRHDDVCTLTPELIETNCGAIDVICGGFPCQDISSAGKGAGIDGERSGLWREYFRVADALRPRWIVAENVPALRTRGADRVLGDLEGIGYACWPIVVGADDVGAPHRRKRVFILARLADAEHNGRRRVEPGRGLAGGDKAELADGDSIGSQGESWDATALCDADGCGAAQLAHAERHAGGDAQQREQRGQAQQRDAVAAGANGGFPPGRNDYARWRRVLEADPRLAPATRVECQVCDVADGLPAGMDSRQRDRWARRWRKETLKALGNSVVPAVAEVIGRGIVAFELLKAEEIENALLAERSL